MDADMRSTAGSTRRRMHRRGTAMTEFVLCLPFLAIVTGLTFFFGWGLMHKHQVLVADRYAAWQRIETGSWPSEDKLNEFVFSNKATNVDLGSQAAIRDTAEDLVTEAGAFGPRTEELADELLLNRFPRGQRARVSASFDANEALWDRFAGQIAHRHSREGLTWPRDQVSCWGTLKDLYYSGFDDSLQRIPPPAHKMAGMIRRLYLARW